MTILITCARLGILLLAVKHRTQLANCSSRRNSIAGFCVSKYMKIKICRKCGEKKKLGDFYKHKKSKDGFRNYCKNCVIKRTAIYRMNNLEKTNRCKYKWVKNNIEKVRRISKRWQRNHYHLKIEYYQKYYKDNINKIKKRNKKWAKNNSEKIKKRKQRWNNNNHGKIREYSRKRRSIKNNAQGSHTEQEWRNKKKECNHRCVYCGINESVLKNKYKDKIWWKLTEDHVIPLIKNGTDYINNIVPACVSCNSSKSAKIINK